MIEKMTDIEEEKVNPLVCHVPDRCLGNRPRRRQMPTPRRPVTLQIEIMGAGIRFTSVAAWDYVPTLVLAEEAAW